MMPPLGFAEYGIPATRSPCSRPCTRASRHRLFHQCGQVKVPSTPSALMEFLAPSLHAVRQPAADCSTRKLWLARYSFDQDGEPSYRLLIQSRNLTPDASWEPRRAFDGWSRHPP
ncbi:hypothetical protein GS416_09845 [Rhodococcus hoagii]|nr:hypothetical protein [Prescottella equi]